jgi:hypothetical protein
MRRTPPHFVVGRKNCLFSMSVEGAKAGANFLI